MFLGARAWSRDLSRELRDVSGVSVTLQLAILWSASLEEQFYVLWPWVVTRLSRRVLLVVAILMLLFSISYLWRLIV
jgi:peptidoglycan/LPS O-acetylase OafA/YrhL